MINLSDNHVHTAFSTDSEASPESMIERAIECGLSSICITDHNDFDFPLKYSNNNIPLFLLDFCAYIEKLTQLREKYSDKITVRIGVEQGLQLCSFDKIETFDKDKKLDFIIGSSHLVDGLDIYYEEYWNNYSKEDAIRHYFESILENVNVFSNYDVYGHIDYVVRYAPEKDKNYNWKDYCDVLEAILKKLINNNKGIEINTAGLKYGLSETNPCTGILKFYKELGGQILTIGSDGHKPEHLAYDFNIVPDILKECGFKYYTEFKNRKPEFISI